MASGSFSSQQDGRPLLPLNEGHGEMTFQVLAESLPRTASFLKLAAGSGEGKTQPPRVGLLRLVSCGSATQEVDEVRHE